jgi:hypothetical protein
VGTGRRLSRARQSTVAVRGSGEDGWEPEGDHARAEAHESSRARASWRTLAEVILNAVGDLLLTATVVFFLPAVLLTSAGTWARLSLRRANRVGPGRSAAAAPIPWLWSPGVAATLHRRLRAACRLARSVEDSRPQPPRRRWSQRKLPPQGDAIVDLAREVAQEAMQLDRELVSTSWLARGAPKAQAMAGIAYRVNAVEDAARRVHQLETSRARMSGPPGPAGLSLNERIAVMEAAFGELGARPAAGLVDAAHAPGAAASADVQALTRPA